MRHVYEPEKDARRYQISNFDPGQCARVEASLALFHKAGGMIPLQARNIKLSQRILQRLQKVDKIRILSPLNEADRGSHISILIENTDMKELKLLMAERGILGDLRRFDDDGYLMRISAVQYNSVEDCDNLLDSLEEILTSKLSARVHI